MNEGYLDVLRSISSSDPTPGGGSVAALTLSHAHSLALMVSRLTSGKEKWSDGHEIADKIIKSSLEGVERSLLLAKKDASAFDSVMNSYRLPKDTEELRIARMDSIHSSTVLAATAPLEIMREAFLLLDSITDLAKHGNSNALTDLLGSAELALSSASIASFNVRINLDSLEPCAEKQNISEEVENLMSLSTDRHSTIEQIIRRRLQWE